MRVVRNGALVLLLGKRAEAECNEATFGDQINKSETENHEQTNPRQPSDL